MKINNYNPNFEYITHTLSPGIEIRYEQDGGQSGWVCPKCGRSISPEYKSCPYCDAKITDEGLAPGEQIITG